MCEEYCVGLSVHRDVHVTRGPKMAQHLTEHNFKTAQTVFMELNSMLKFHIANQFANFQRTVIAKVTAI